MSDPQSQVVALAALLLHCQSVDQLARTGVVPAERLRTAMRVLLDQSHEGALAQCRDPDHLHLGLELLDPFLRGEQRALSPEVLRYMVGILYLQRRLQRDAATRQRIYAGIEHAGNQAKLFSPTHDNVIANVAQCYQDTLAVAARVRCMLFAAVRAAVLWHQSGGRRWHLMLRRRQLLARSQRLKSRI
jgi:high frequency lysogenization protein